MIAGIWQSSWHIILIVGIVSTRYVVWCDHYTDHYAVQVEGGVDEARHIAVQHGFVFVNEIMSGYYQFRHPRVAKRSVFPDAVHHVRLSTDSRIKWVEQQVSKRRVKRDVQSMFDDPMWPQQWYLNRGLGLDMNVVTAYKWHITGKDVVVTILDDGIEKDHPDLSRNYDADASYDVNGRDNDPQPRYDPSNENRHGTRCAGEVAAEANNRVCGVGIAYDARIGGVRMLDGQVTDAVEAQSLALDQQHIDVFSASWGPDDDGRTVDGPGPLARKAFIDGIQTGRRGLGSIFVWASGNGGTFHDNCNCDGYTNSIFTLSISSASENGLVPWYSEACSSTLATTYSSGTTSERQISTTDLHHHCTDRHTGTSASAPLAAGICSLALEANRLLTWRDMQHIVVQTAQRANLQADDWVSNGAGHNVSHHFGFGLLDAGAMVELAMEWQTVPRQRHCTVSADFTDRTVPLNGMSQVTLTSDGCDGEVKFLEHVEAVVTMSASVRGQVTIYLTSPSGTRSTLLTRRGYDRSTDGFNSWSFMSTHCWGESPNGVWTLEVRNGDSVSTLKNWSVVLHGTRDDPQPPLTGFRRRLDPGQYTCDESEFFLLPFCYSECPKHFYAANDTLTDAANETSSGVSRARAVCLRCHVTCLLCSGPAHNQCLNCSIHRRLTVDHQCVTVDTDRRLSVLAVVAITVLPVAVVGVVAVTIWQWLMYRRNSNRWRGLRSEQQHRKALLTQTNDDEYDG